MFFWNSLAFSMIQRMLALWSLVPLPFLKPAWTSGSSRFMYCWSLVWRILSITLLACEMSATVWYCTIAILFNSWVIFYCVYVPQLSYPFICWWTSRLLPCPGYCKQCCDEHWGTRVSFNSGFLSVCAQQWDCWVTFFFLYFPLFHHSFLYFQSFFWGHVIFFFEVLL